MIYAEPSSVWMTISDPYHLARWWPGVKRVEDVHERKRSAGMRWTSVLTTRSGRDVRADFRCLHARQSESYAWEQELKGTPFERFLRSSVTTIELEEVAGGLDASHGEGHGQGLRTRVSLELDQRLRGINRLGGFIARRAARRQLDEALDGLERALGATP